MLVNDFMLNEWRNRRIDMDRILCKVCFYYLVDR